MTDCYSGNLGVVLDKKSQMIQMACWPNARRKIIEAKDNDLADSAFPLALISQLYGIERPWFGFKQQRANQTERERIAIDLGSIASMA